MYIFFSNSDLSFYLLSHALIFNLFKYNKIAKTSDFCKKFAKVRECKTFLLNDVNHIERPDNFLNNTVRKI